MGDPQCRLSILRNGNVLCHYFSNVPGSAMSPVEFKKMLCRPVEFKGQGAKLWERLPEGVQKATTKVKFKTMIR